MAVRTRGGLTVPDLDARDEIDPAIAAHEARHAAAALLLGLEVKEARADNPNPEMGGYVALGHYPCLRPREAGIMTLAGRWGDAGWPPERPSKSGVTFDERHLADDVETLGEGQRGYELLVADTSHLVCTPEFKQLTDMLELLLARGCVLRKQQLEDIHRVVVGKTKLDHKTIKAASRVSTDRGEFSALAAAWSVDRENDQIVRGAFAKTIERWQGSGKRIPLHWNHSPDPKDIIGWVDPAAMRETGDGLFVRGKVDLASDMARQAWRLMKNNAVSLSFGYLVTDETKRSDGVRELREIDLFEVSIVPAPANADTRILSTKSATPSVDQDTEPELEFDFLPPRMPAATELDWIRRRARDEMRTLLGPTDPVDALDREEKHHARELRRKCDRLQLEAALGFDQDLIDKLDL
jgi:HK97 family phage prohead protease